MARGPVAKPGRTKTGRTKSGQKTTGGRKADARKKAGKASAARPSAPKLAIARRGMMLVLSSPSGAGKTTLSRMLLDHDPAVELSVSVTTRTRRANEKDGIDYHFIDRARFDHMVEAGELLEWAEVFGNLYGTPRAPVEASLAAGRDVLFDIDWQGTQQLREKARGDMASIFVLPPSMRELEQRLRERRSDGEPEIARRLARAREEIALWRNYDYLIVNRDVKEAIDQLEAIVQAERCRVSRLALNFPDLEVPN
jgi:guanylate kinase